MTVASSARLNIRRRLLQAGGALAVMPWRTAHAAGSLPEFPVLSAYLAGRSPKLERMLLQLPQLADNGLTVPMKVTVDGPFSAASYVSSVRLFSEVNPVPEMAVFEFPQPIERVEIESRVRLASTQHVVAVATMSDGGLYAAVAEVVVTLAGCMDGT